MVLDFSAEAAADPDFLLEVGHVRQWEAEHEPLPDGGWLLYRTGWDARSASQQDFLNANETGPHTPGVSVAARSGWPARRRSSGSAWNRRHGRGRRAFVRSALPLPLRHAGAGKYGLTQLQNLGALPPTGAVVVAGPLPITGGSGSPARVLALVERP